MQAIEVKETVDRNGNHRFRASCAAKSIWRYSSDLEQRCREQNIPYGSENYAKLIAEELKNILDWNGYAYGRMVMGTLKNGNYVFVFTGREE